ncbi:MAG: hypothetical protein HY902_13565 [Deltaproteobacteria bacterium]|nr:hypothetical protein [Deltaproteobacteria bacterium]
MLIEPRQMLVQSSARATPSAVVASLAAASAIAQVGARELLSELLHAAKIVSHGHSQQERWRRGWAQA